MSQPEPQSLVERMEHHRVVIYLAAMAAGALLGWKAMYVSCGFWHRSWGAISVRHLDVRLRGTGSCETAYALSPHIRN